MATILAPFSNAMKLGSGFNSFTQELCVDHAVVRAEDSKPDVTERALDQAGVAQSVAYKTSIIDKVTDVTDALNINAAFTVKYDKLNADGHGGLMNTNTIKSSDMSFMISVKVVNQIIMDHSLTKFVPINGLRPNNFTSVYGDSFISGFQEGGDFTALISVKVSDREQLESVKAEAKLAFTGDKLQLTGAGDIDKSKKDFLAENETTISVSWTGGGQNLKKPDEDWTWDTMRAAALKFPDLVAKTPMRTHAILTKYAALKSFQSIGPQYSPLSYEHAGNYATALQEAYLDYKNIAKNIQVLAFDVVNGTQTLAAKVFDHKDAAENAVKASKPALLASMTVQGGSNTTERPNDAGSSDEDSFTAVKVSDTAAGSATKASNHDGESSTIKDVQPLVIEAPYPATIFGLEAARVHCRFMMNRIVSEVDAVTKHPAIATDELRPLPYMSPFLFQTLLPVGLPAFNSTGFQQTGFQQTGFQETGFQQTGFQQA